MRIIESNFLSMNKNALAQLILHGGSVLNYANTSIRNWVVEYITSTKRFNNPLIL